MLRQGADPEEDVTILPDWGGRVTLAFGLRDTGLIAAAAVIDGEGRVAGIHQGESPGEEALDLLAGLAGRDGG